MCVGEAPLIMAILNRLGNLGFIPIHALWRKNWAPMARHPDSS
jgi:hypothetical protein